MEIKDINIIGTGDQIGHSPVFSPSYTLSGFGYKILGNLNDI